MTDIATNYKRYVDDFEQQVEDERKAKLKQIITEIINEAYQGKAIYSRERTDVLLNSSSPNSPR